MLELALQAGLPLISIHTEDTVNIADVLSYMTDSSVIKLDQGHLNKLGLDNFEEDSKYFSIESPDNVKYSCIYESLVNTNRTLIVINPEHKDSLIYDLGVLKVPTGMLTDFIAEIALEDDVDAIVGVLGGLSLKDVGEICRLCQTKYQSLTPRGLMEIRRQYIGSIKGIQQISTIYNFYKPTHFLNKWLAVDGKIFNDYTVPKELVPRGLMFTGLAGTGKTMGAKYLANQLGIPLYRLDLGALLDKYIGESEANLQKALNIADNSQPCVLLLDEVEKIFGNSDDSGVSGRLLSALLWWLQERTSRILVVMTTNDDTGIPVELYRPGRIDECMEFVGIKDYISARLFMSGVLESLYPDADDKFTEDVFKELDTLHNFLLTENETEAVVYKEPVSHAALTQLMSKAIKQVLVGS